MRIAHGLVIATLAAALGGCSGHRQPAGASDGKHLVTADSPAPKPAASASGGAEVAIVDPDGNQLDAVSQADLDDAIARQGGAAGGESADEDPGIGDGPGDDK